jgi:hypothetical protein
MLLASLLIVHLVSAGAALGGLQDGLVAYYRFNGNASDESGNANHGTVHGAVPCRDRAGQANSAYCFDGDDYIHVPSSASLKSPTTALSVAAWVFVGQWYAGYAAVCTKSNDAAFAQYGYALYQFNRQVFLEVHGSYVQIGSGTAFETGRWYHVAYTWDGATVRLYVDGALTASTPLVRTPQTDERPLVIGKHTPGDTEHLNGRLDQLRIYNRALSAQEVAELYLVAPDTPPPSPCAGAAEGFAPR